MFPKIVEFSFTFPGSPRPTTLGIYSYGLMLALGFIVSGLLLKRELKRKQLDENLSNNIVLSAIIFGIAGAKAYSIIQSWREFIAHPLSSIFSGSGLVWYGGMIFGSLGVLYVIRKSSAPSLIAIDLLAPLIALGYAFGRVGCFLSGDGDYGPPSDLPWAMAFPKGTVPPTHYGFDLYQKLHPTPIYESLMSIAIFFIIWSIRKRSYKPGSMFAFYLILAGIERFIAEFWRLTSVVSMGLTMAQLISIVMVAGGGYMLLKVRSAEHKPYSSEAQKSPSSQSHRKRKRGKQLANSSPNQKS